MEQFKEMTGPSEEEVPSVGREHTEQDARQERRQQLSESDTESVRRIRRRRLVLQFEPDSAPSQRDGSEGPHGDEDEPFDATGVPLTNSVRVDFESLDVVNLESVFEIRGLVMKYVPKFMRGVFRGAIKTSLQAILRGRERNDIEVETRGWKLLMLIPRLLLTGPPRGGLVPQERLKERVARFNAGECKAMLQKSTQKEGNERTPEQGWSCAGIGEGGRVVPCSKGFGVEAVAPGSEKTWKALTDEAKRPRTAREGIDQELMVVKPNNHCGFGCGSLVEEFEFFPPRCSGRPIRNDHRTSEDPAGHH